MIVTCSSHFQAQQGTFQQLFSNPEALQAMMQMQASMQTLQQSAPSLFGAGAMPGVGPGVGPGAGAMGPG